MRRYNYTEVIDMSANRDHYTKHRLHMNGIGKDWLARSIVNTINKLCVNQELAPIILEWEESSVKREQLKTIGNKESDFGIEQ